MSAGAHLVEVHDHLRAELEQLRDLLAEVLAGRLDPAAARSEINAMTLRQNDWTLGFYCARYCRTVTTHHAIEDASVFPHLRSEDPSLAPVLDRLQAEHRVTHDLLEGIDRSLVAFVSGPDGAGVLRAALDSPARCAVDAPLLRGGPTGRASLALRLLLTRSRHGANEDRELHVDMPQSAAPAGRRSDVGTGVRSG